MYPKEDKRASSLEKWEPPQVVTLALVGNEPQRLLLELGPFVEFVNTLLAGQNIQLQPYVADSRSALKKAVSNGEVDFYIDSPFAVYDVVKTGRMRAIARQWRDGIAEYHSVILSLKESQIEDLEDLNGRRIAFEDNGSSSSFHLPASALLQAGLAILPETKASADPRSPHVRFRLSSRDETSVEWMRQGEVDAAAVSSVYFDALSPELKSAVRVILKTRSIPRQLVSIRTNLSPAVEDLVIGTLFDMETSSEGRLVLDRFYNTRRFDLIPSEGELRQQLITQLADLPWSP